MRRWAAALKSAGSTRSRKAKVAALAEGLRALAGEPNEGLAIATRWASGQTLAPQDPRTVGVGWALLAEVAVKVAGVPMSTLSSSTREAGDLGDAVGILFGDREAPGLPLVELARLMEAVASTTDRAAKEALLTEAFQKCTADEARFLVKGLTGELRIGVQRSTVEEALAVAFGRTIDEVRSASASLADAGALAIAARDGTLSQATFVPGAPLAFMLASPAESVKAPVDVANTIAEDKLDGIRVQVQVANGRVWLFGRGQGEVTLSFPELVPVFQRAVGLRGGNAGTGTMVIDGEIIAVAPDGKARPFQALQARLNRVNPSFALQEEVPVGLVAYDLMVDEVPLLAKPWTERRDALERRIAAIGSPKIRVNPVHPLAEDRPLDDQLDALFKDARARGNEGLVLKDVRAVYDAGKRGSAWRKVKRALATLDVVVVAAEWGHGKRTGVLSDYTFAVWDGDRLLEIGKAYSGLTDKEIAVMTERFLALTVEKNGGWHRVKPEVVLEVAFDGLQRSKQHASGFALRFPRIARIRDDKKPEDADTLETAEALFLSQVDSGHREEAPAQAGLFPDEPPRG